MGEKKEICGKRGRFLCTLDKGHGGMHGRRYRRDIKIEKAARLAALRCACHQGGHHTQDLD